MAYIIDSEFPNAENIRTTTECVFRAADRTITLNISDLVRVLYIINLDSDTVIYNPSVPNKGGRVYGNNIDLDFDTTNMSNNDLILIGYETPGQELSILNLLENILEESQEQTKLLQKIYK